MCEDFDPIAYINEPRWSHSSLGLERIQLLLEKLGNPQNQFRSIHVAGTNGKGSTCAYMSSVLRAAGLKVALFTSPYIECFEERIQVNGRAISLDDLRTATLLVRDAAAEVEDEQGEHPTEFELMAAVAFVHFARVGCDIAVVEVGLGGRLDATNVVHPDLCVIARIGLDHTDVLGDTLAQIAAEKAGIIKSSVPVVSWPQEPEAMNVIAQTCEDLNCCLCCPDFSQLEVGRLDMQNWTRTFSYQGESFTTRLVARYQPYNAALAIEAIRHLQLPNVTRAQLEEALSTGIAATQWPGRFEVVSTKPIVVIDGSHNPQGADALAETLHELTCADDTLRGNITFVMGVLADKEYPHIIAPVLPFARRFVVYTPPSPRALSAEGLADEIARQAPEMEVVCCESPACAIDAVLKIAADSGSDGAHDTVVAFGTLYAIGALKQELRKSGCIQ